MIKTQIAFLMLLSIWIHALPQEPLSIEKIEIVSAIADKADRTRASLLRRGSMSDSSHIDSNVVYLVKVYLTRNEYGSVPLKLIVNGEEISSYGSFSKGMFFRVYSRRQLKEWEGKTLTLQRVDEGGKSTIISTLAFPSIQSLDYQRKSLRSVRKSLEDDS